MHVWKGNPMNLLECHGLTKKYGNKTALDQIDLSVGAGKIVGLLGPNGSGKTTLIKLATRLLQPTQGQILIDGHQPDVYTKSIVSYLPDREYLPDWMKVRQLLKFYQDFFQDFQPERAQEMLRNLDISPEMNLKKMSKGTKEKVRLILTMSRDAKLYLLDEPIAGVDPAARDYILQTILQNFSDGSTILISTHLISDVETVLDEAVFLKNGQIILHKPTDAIREETGRSVDAYFREVFKC